MYGMVSSDNRSSSRSSKGQEQRHHHHSRQHHHQYHHRVQEEEEEDDGGVDQGGGSESTIATTTAGGGGRHRRNRGHHHRRSLYTRFLNFMRQAWTGVKFALESDLLDEIDSPPRYRPESIKSLCRLTRFSEKEIKRLYRGFKAECPSGVVQEETFRDIYAQFFPQGANTTHYAHYVFNTLDQGRNGLLSFEDFIIGLSILSRGTLDEKLRWTFTLYDINGDGYITKEEMRDVVTAVYELMGTCTEPNLEEDAVNEKVERIFTKMDQNQDGVVSMDEFLLSCTKDENITRSICVFDSVI